MKSLKNKIIIVTGGNGLIGKEIITNIKSYGAIVYNFDLKFSSKSNFNIKCDITNHKEIDTSIQKIISKHKRIDGLVNNAYPRTSDWNVKFENINYKSWNKNFEMQMTSIFYLCQKITQIMKIQNCGSIVNISSIYGIVGNNFNVYENTNGMTSPAAYSAIKAGIINFTRYLASYYGKYNIRINCVSPGGIFNGQNNNFIKNYSYQSPLKRLGKASEISPSVSFLLSDDSSYITGHNLVVDGGWTAI